MRWELFKGWSSGRRALNQQPKCLAWGARWGGVIFGRMVVYLRSFGMT